MKVRWGIYKNGVTVEQVQREAASRNISFSEAKNYLQNTEGPFLECWDDDAKAWLRVRTEVVYRNE